MRRALILAVLALSAACRREPDFDQRYKAAQQRLEAKSAGIDRDLASAAAESGTPPASR